MTASHDPDRRRRGFAKRLAYKHAGALLLGALSSVGGFLATAVYTMIFLAPRVSAVQVAQATTRREQQVVRDQISALDRKITDGFEVLYWYVGPYCAALSPDEFARAAKYCGVVAAATRQVFTPRPRRGR